MPCGETIFSPTMPPVKKEDKPSNTLRSTVNIETCLLKLRNLCREHGLQIWDKQSLSDQIYQDILFIWHIPRLMTEGILTLDVSHIGGGKMSEVSYSALLSLKEEKLIAGAFKTLWRSLQRSEVSAFFDGREFSMFSIEKKDNKADKYFKLLKAIVEYFASIELASYDSNAGYTYFKKDLNKGTAKTFGQFYTPKPVLHSVIQEVKPQPGEKILDPSSGSCSFIQETAIDLMSKHNLSPKEAFENLYGVEIEQNIYQEGAMNIFLNFGLLPNMVDNIREGDSFHLLLEDDTKYDKIVANPPFGADASSFFGKYFKEELVQKGKRTVKVISENPEVKVKIPFTKTKESAVLFFQIIVQKLVDGGKAGVVMSATIFNDGFKDMMKWFLECCSLEKVIINPAGTFKDQGTGIETFSFIFIKGSPTTKIDIVMLGAEDVVVRSLTLDQVKEAGWKLQVKEEEKKVEYTGQYEVKKLGDIAKLKGGFPFKSSDYVDNGLIVLKHNNLQNGSVELSKSQDYIKESSDTNDYLLQKGDIVVSMDFDCGKVGKILQDGWVLNQRMTLVRTIGAGIVSQEFLYWLLHIGGFYGALQKVHTGTTIKHISGKNIADVSLPLPPLPIQEEIVTALDRIFADPQDMKDCLAFTDKAMDLMLKDPSGKLLEDVMGALRLKRAQLAAAASIKAQMAAVMRSVGARGYEKKKLGGMIEMLGGKRRTIQEATDDGQYDFITCSIMGTSRINVADFNKEAIIINAINGSGRCRPYYSEKYSTTTNNIHFTLKGDCNYMSLKYLYKCLDLNSKLLEEGFSGGNQKKIGQEYIKIIEMPVPPLPVQREILTILNEMEAEMKTLQEMAEKTEKRAKFILGGYLSSPLATTTVE